MGNHADFQENQQIFTCPISVKTGTRFKGEWNLGGQSREMDSVSAWTQQDE